MTVSSQHPVSIKGAYWSLLSSAMPLTGFSAEALVIWEKTSEINISRTSTTRTTSSCSGGQTTSLQKFEDEAGNNGATHILGQNKDTKRGSESAPAPITIADQTVDVTDKFTYLGSGIDSRGYCGPDIRRKLGLASSTMGQLERVWRNKRLSTPIKICIYCTCVLRYCSMGLKPGHYQLKTVEKSRRFT